MDLLTPVTASSQALPTRESSRKRVRKTLGPDFIEDFTVHRVKLDDERRIPPPAPISRKPLLAAVLKKPIRPVITKVTEPAMKRPRLTTSSYRGGSLRVCSECVKNDMGDRAYDDQEDILRCAGNCGYAAHTLCMSDSGKYLYNDWYCGKCSLTLKKKKYQKKKKLAMRKAGVNSDFTAPLNAGKKSIPLILKRNDRKSGTQGTSRILSASHPAANVVARQSVSSEEHVDEVENPYSEDARASSWFFGKPELMQYTMPEFEFDEEEEPDQQEADRELRLDLAVWTVEQCAAYFNDSFPEMADLIKAHELMGSALVMLSRSQFLSLFDLPIGTALKMHAAVCKCRRKFF